jgi:very-short-patch-repair endonuclease
MTMPERILWSRLRAGRLNGLKFRRQHPLGSYIADFYCDEAATAIEVDGFTSHSYVLHERDAIRTLWLEKRDVQVLRVTASWVSRDADAVARWIGERVRDQIRLLNEGR